MTNDIKDVVERLKFRKTWAQNKAIKPFRYPNGAFVFREIESASMQLVADDLSEAIAAVTTLSEENEAMKAEIERFRKAFGLYPEKKDWCLCGVGIGNKGHNTFCTAYYSPKHPQLIPPRQALKEAP